MKTRLKKIVNSFDEPVYSTIIFIIPRTIIIEISIISDLIFKCRFLVILEVSFNKVFDAESNDVTAKASMVIAVKTYIIFPLEKDNVYPVAALTKCHMTVNIIKEKVPYFITCLILYPLLQYATNRPQNTDHATTVASKYHQ